MGEIEVFGYTLTLTFIIANIIGFVAVLFSMLSFQRKDNKGLFAMQLIAALLFGVQYFLLGSWSGVIFNIIACFRGYLLCREKKISPKALAITVVILCTVALVGIFLIFKEWMAVFPFLAMVLSTLSMCSGNGKVIRLVQLCVISPCWITFNLITLSIAGMTAECFTMISIIISIVRYGINGFEVRK